MYHEANNNHQNVEHVNHSQNNADNNYLEDHVNHLHKGADNHHPKVEHVYHSQREA